VGRASVWSWVGTHPLVLSGLGLASGRSWAVALPPVLDGLGRTPGPRTVVIHVVMEDPFPFRTAVCRADLFPLRRTAIRWADPFPRGFFGNLHFGGGHVVTQFGERFRLAGALFRKKDKKNSYPGTRL